MGVFMTQEVGVEITIEKINELVEEALNSPRVVTLIQQFVHSRREYFSAMSEAFGPRGGAIPDVDRVRDEYHPTLVRLLEAIQSTALEEAREELEATTGE